MNEEARAFELRYSCILFFKLVLRTLSPEYLRHFLALVGFLAQPNLILPSNLFSSSIRSVKSRTQLAAEHPSITSVKSRTQSAAELLFNSYAENPPLVHTDIARGENRYSRKISSSGSGFCPAIAIYRSHSVLGSQKDFRANSLLAVNA